MRLAHSPSRTISQSSLANQSTSRNLARPTTAQRRINITFPFHSKIHLYSMIPRGPPSGPSNCLSATCRSPANQRRFVWQCANVRPVSDYVTVVTCQGFSLTPSSDALSAKRRVGICAKWRTAGTHVPPAAASLDAHSSGQTCRVAVACQPPADIPSQRSCQQSDALGEGIPSCVNTSHPCNFRALCRNCRHASFQLFQSC